MESMGAAFDESFKKRYRRNKEALEWYDALAMAVAVIAIVFTFFVRIVKVDGHSMDPTLFNGERILINLMKQPDYGDIVVVDGYTSYGKPLVKRVIGKGGGRRRGVLCCVSMRLRWRRSSGGLRTSSAAPTANCSGSSWKLCAEAAA